MTVERQGEDEAAGGTTLRSALVRFALLGLLLLAALVALRWTPLGELLDRQALAAWILELRHAWWAGLALLGLYLVLSPVAVPISPLVFAGAAVYGPLWGFLYNFVGSMLGATASYLLARSLGRDLVIHLAGERRLRRIDRLLAEHGFWHLVRLRFVPMPFAVTNFGTALAGVTPSTFLASSALGLAPSVLIYTYLSSAVMTVAIEDRAAVIRNGTLLLLAVLALTFLPALGRALARRAERRKSRAPQR